MSANLCCSFCQKSRIEVRVLVAGPEGFICSQCIQTCREILTIDDVATFVESMGCTCGRKQHTRGCASRVALAVREQYQLVRGDGAPTKENQPTQKET